MDREYLFYSIKTMNNEFFKVYFKWFEIDPSLPQSNIPCLLRGNGVYAPLRIINQLIYSNYVYNIKFLLQFCINPNDYEANLLNLINSKFNYVYGDEQFDRNDLLYPFNDFLKLYKIHKNTVPMRHIGFRIAPLKQMPEPIEMKYSPDGDSLKLPVSAPKKTYSYEKDEIIEIEEKEEQVFNDIYSLIQVNEHVLVSIELEDSSYSYNKTLPSSHTFLIVQDLVSIGLFDRDTLKNHTNTSIQNSTGLIKCKNWLNKKLGTSLHTETDLGKYIELINVLELQFVNVQKPIFFKKLKSADSNLQNFESLLNLEGGLVRVGNLILPFVKLDDCLITPLTEHGQEEFKIDNKELINEFFKLLSVYSSTNFQYEKFIKIGSNYEILYKFDTGFPKTWTMKKRARTFSDSCFQVEKFKNSYLKDLKQRKTTNLKLKRNDRVFLSRSCDDLEFVSQVSKDELKSTGKFYFSNPSRTLEEIQHVKQLLNYLYVLRQPVKKVVQELKKSVNFVRKIEMVKPKMIKLVNQLPEKTSKNKVLKVKFNDTGYTGSFKRQKLDNIVVKNLSRNLPLGERFLKACLKTTEKENKSVKTKTIVSNVKKVHWRY